MDSMDFVCLKLCRFVYVPLLCAKCGYLVAEIGCA